MEEPDISREEATRLQSRAAVRGRLERKGIDRVRAEFADRTGFNTFQLDVMREWLAEKRAESDAARQAVVDQSEREARMEASSLESLRIARSAKNAAWAAAIAAVIAIAVAVVMPFIT